MKDILRFAAFAVLVLGAREDLRSMTIPDRTHLLLAAAGIGLSFCPGTPGLPDRVLAAMLGGGISLVFALAFPGGLGGGDVKLVAGGGFLLGTEALPGAVWFSLWPCALFSLFLLATGSGRDRPVPLGPFLAFGMGLSLLA
ncbi:MAG: prepilin peptidase [Eubacterium sp.]|nr:prepilin peptidase [Eubacterium sp.]